MQHEVFEHDLGGAKGLVVHVPSSRVMSLSIRFNSGFEFGDFGIYEMPHVLEHLVGGATTNYPEPLSLKIEIQKNGAWRNAFTNSLSNRYAFECADFEADRILDLQREIFVETKFPQDVVTMELGNVRQELSGYTAQPGRVCGVIFGEAGFPDRIMRDSKRLAQLDSITPDKLQEYYRKSHTFNNARFYLAGNFPDKGKAAVQRLSKALEGLPKGERFDPITTPGQKFSPIAISWESEPIYYDLGWFSAELPIELWPASVILESLLGEGYASRIHGAARHRGLAYHVFCEADASVGNSSLGFSGNVTPDNVAPLFELISSEMTKVRSGEVTSEEVESFRNLRTGSMLRAYQLGGQLLNWYMSHYEERGVIEDFDGWIDKLRAVTREQVIEVARHLTSTQARGSVFLGRVNDEQARQHAALLDPVSAS